LVSRLNSRRISDVQRRTRTLVTASAAVLCALGWLAAAGAQPRRRPPPAEKPEAGAAAASKDDAGGALSQDGGALSAEPAVRTDWDAAAKLSPLTPSPPEFSQGLPEGGAPPVDYDKLIADVAALRSRVATLSDGLFRSKLAIELETDGDRSKITRVSVSVDDGVVFPSASDPQAKNGGAGFHAEDYTPVFEHSIAPGKHAITVDADRSDLKDESFKTSARTRFTVDVPKDLRLLVQIRIEDNSTMGADFPGDRSGKYDLRFRVKAVAKGGK
jgi:hypothetical protein